MKTMVLLYDTSCIYEIVILNYFLNATGKEMIFVSPEGNPVMATEGYRIEAEDRLDHVNPGDVELLIIPGGDITQIDTPEVWEYLKMFTILMVGSLLSVQVLMCWSMPDC